MTVRRSIEEALRRARVFPDAYTASDLKEAQRVLARDLLELRWMQLLALDADDLGPHPAAGRHEQAGHDLRLLCRGTVHHDGAAACVTAFDDRRDPDGALTFACLLHLADRTEGARFWWHYAAGAGSVTAALCVYLLHLQHGELKDARHWATQIPVLDDLEWSTYLPVAHRAWLCPSANAHGSVVLYTLPDVTGAAPCRSALVDAVEDLGGSPDDDHGPVPQPSSALADRWDDLVGPC
ncbi:hypothetical protein ACIQU5_05660 [Streptomyces sp. NPDC090306]|uniref:hypothetical protein n=1 Tax=Streptomyces sp. NPDC090306 TaxID=3365961 RepID=UPI003829E0C8